MKRWLLTIAVPIYNMERWLEKNLFTYDDPRLIGRVEVLCLNNASNDGSKAIIEKAVQKSPEIFTLIDRSSRGYGGSINEAITRAKGQYFRIVDADDWVNTDELVRLVNALEQCENDVVLTDYEIVDLQTGNMTPVRAGNKGATYEKTYTNFSAPTQTLPSIHASTYRTAILRESGFQMQDEIFFVDEEYVILPYLWVKSVIYYPFDIYRYQVANPNQSTSPKNRAKYWEHREQILKRLLHEYNRIKQSQPDNSALNYCFERIKRGIGDHFTTLYMYMENRKLGRKLAQKWRQYLQTCAPEFLSHVKKKAAVLQVLNCLHVELEQYENIKKICKYRGATLL